MRALLALVVASAAVTLPVPAAAVDPEQMAFVGNSGVTIHGGSFVGRVDRNRDRRHRDSDGDIFIGEWPQQGDTAWRSDSFNDWWHDRPDRAYPRWMLNNQNCEKRWYQGDLLKC